MKNKDMLNILNLADDNYIDEADPKNAKNIYSSKAKRRKIIQAGVLAAVTVCIGIIITLMFLGNDPGDNIDTKVDIAGGIINIKVDNPDAYYSIQQENDNYYIIMEQKSPSYSTENGDTDKLPISHSLRFESVSEMKNRVLGGLLTEDEKKTVSQFKKDEDGRIYFLDFTDLYDPVLPYGTYVSASGVTWTGGNYTVSLQSDIFFGGKFDALTEQEYIAKLEDRYLKRMPNTNDKECVGTEKITVGNSEATVVYNRPAKTALTKTVLYEIELEQGSLMVIEVYALENNSISLISDVIPVSVEVIGNMQDHYFYYYISDFYQAPSYEWISSFGARSINDIPDYTNEIPIYDFSVFYSELQATNGKSSLEDIVKKTERNGMKKYIKDDSDDSIYGEIYKTIVSADKKVNFKGSEYEVVESLYFCSGDLGILATVHVTKDMTLVDLGKYGIHTWEEHSEIFGRFAEYGKPLYSEYPYYFEYFTGVFPFLDLDADSEALGKEVQVNNASDLKVTEKDLLNDLKKNFKGTSFSNEATVITYRGLFDNLEKDIYSVIEAAVKSGNFNYVVYNSGDGIKVSSAYKTSEQIFDRYYLLPCIKYFESCKDTFKLDGKEYLIKQKVYFHDITYGFVGILITDNGTFAATYDPFTEKSAIYNIEDLGKLKECYLKYKEAYSVYHYSFCAYITNHHESLTEGDHETIEKKIDENKMRPDSNKDILNTNLKKELGFSGDAVILSSWSRNFTDLFAQKSSITDIFEFSIDGLTPNYYVSEALKTLYKVKVTPDGQLIKEEITGTHKDIFLRVYYYTHHPKLFFEDYTKFKKVYYLENEPNGTLIIYLETDKGDYVLYAPNLAKEDADHKIYFMPIEDFFDIAWKTSLNYMSLKVTGEGGTAEYSEYSDCSSYVIDAEKKEYSFPAVVPPTEPDDIPLTLQTPQTEPAETAPPITEEMPKYSNTFWCFIGASTLVFVLIVVIAFMCFKKCKKTTCNGKENSMDEKSIPINGEPANESQNSENTENTENTERISTAFTALKKQKRKTLLFAFVALVLAMILSALLLSLYLEERQAELDTDYSEIITKLQVYDKTTKDKALTTVVNDVLYTVRYSVGRFGYVEAPYAQEGEITSADLIKTSKKYIYYISHLPEKKSQTPNILRIYTKDGEDSKEVGSFNITTRYLSKYDCVVHGMYLSKDFKTATIILTYYHDTKYGSNYTEVISLDVSDPANIEEKNRITVSGSDVYTRMVDGKLMLFVNYWADTSKYSDDVRYLIPQIDDGSGFENIPATKIISPDVITDKEFTVILKINEKTLKIEDSLACLSCHTYEDFYITEDNIYLMSTYFRNTDTGEIGPSNWFGINKSKTISETSLTRISSTGRRLKYKGSLQIDGYFNGQYNINENGRVLRAVATTLEVVVQRSKTSGNLYCIDLKKMKVTSKVEQFTTESALVCSVRYDQDRAYVGTTLQEQFLDSVILFDLSDLNNITYTQTDAIDAYSSALLDFGDDLYMGLNYGKHGTEFKLEIYKETDGKPELISDFEIQDTKFLRNYNFHFIDKDKKLIGIEIHKYHEGYSTYQFLHFDGKEIRPIGEFKVLDEQYYYSAGMRGFYSDGYLYVLCPSESEPKVIKVDIGT